MNRGPAPRGDTAEQREHGFSLIIGIELGAPAVSRAAQPPDVQFELAVGAVLFGLVERPRPGPAQMGPGLGVMGVDVCLQDRQHRLLVCLWNPLRDDGGETDAVLIRAWIGFAGEVLQIVGQHGHVAVTDPVAWHSPVQRSAGRVDALAQQPCQRLVRVRRPRIGRLVLGRQ